MKKEYSYQSTFDYYRSNAEKFFKSTAYMKLDHIYQPFLEHLPDTGTILDAGCGSGRDSKFFIKNGFSVTAFDNSPEMVKLASEFIGQKCLLLSFENINFTNRFDGVWACASLLHVPKNKMANALEKLINALKPAGIMYVSFKYGNTESISEGRYFSNYDEKNFSALLEKTSRMKPVKFWKTKDLRPGRKNETWLNVLIRKNQS